MTNFKSLQGLPTLPLPSLLRISGWVILTVLFAMLFLDGILFYQYGLGHAALPASSLPGKRTSFRVAEEDIRSAAAAAEARRAQFEAAPILPLDLPNPFRT